MTDEGTQVCPECAETIKSAAVICLYCKYDFRSRTGPPAGPGAPAGTTAETYVTWEDESAGIFSRWWSTWAESQFGADRFFSRMPWTGGYGKPLKFVLFFTVQLLSLAFLCVGPVVLILLTVGSSSGRGFDVGGLEAGIIVLVFVGGIVALFVGQILGTFISSAINHVCVMIVGGRGPFEATYRAVCYSWGCGVWGLIPSVGGLINLVFHVICLTHGFAYAHGISKGRALLAVFLPIIFCCGGFVVVFIVMFATIGAAGFPRY